MIQSEQRGTEVRVEDVQQADIAEVDRHTLRPARFAGLPRQVEPRVLPNREPAQHDVAELVTPQLARRRHHPSHAERGAELFGVSGTRRAGADDLLQRDHVGVDRGEHGRDAVGTHPAVEPAAAMDVVGDDPQVAPVSGGAAGSVRHRVRAAASPAGGGA
jgi:hypothetical protein